MASIALVAQDHTDHTVTFAINGVRYEYWLTLQQCDTIDFLSAKVSQAKALAFAKRKASKWQKA